MKRENTLEHDFQQFCFCRSGGTLFFVEKKEITEIYEMIYVKCKK